MKSLATLVTFACILLILLLPKSVYGQDTTETRIVMPTIAVDSTVIPVRIRYGTWDMRRLTQTVGYFTGTAWFGEGGNIGLGGHSEKAIPTSPDCIWRT